jgi:aryl-alcohol dehydrogenase-like predicted oxidoreductase
MRAGKVRYPGASAWRRQFAKASHGEGARVASICFHAESLQPIHREEEREMNPFALIHGLR